MTLEQIASTLPQLLYIIKFFGTIIVSLLSIIAMMGGVIWNNLRKEIKTNKEDAQNALKEHKEDRRKQCNLCYQANIKEHEELWEAIDICCPRGGK